MLGVHGEQPLRLSLDEIHDELAADDQRLLVRQRHGLAVLERGHGGGQARGPDEGVEHDVGLRVAGERLGCLRSDEHLHAAQRADPLLDVGGRVLVGDRDQRGQELADLAHEELLVRAGDRQPHHPEALGIVANDIQRLGPDRPCGAEDGHRLHAIKTTPTRPQTEQVQPRTMRKNRNAAGATNSSESIRSSTPPWPGSTLPMSLMSRSRFTRDSAKSPNVAAAATTRANRSASTRRFWKASTNDGTSAAPTITVMSVAPIVPSIDLRGLVLGASALWNSEPPHTCPTRNAEVSKTNVSPITVTTSPTPLFSVSVTSRYPASSGIQATSNSVSPMLSNVFRRWAPGTAMNHRKVATTPRANMASIAASPWR